MSIGNNLMGSPLYVFLTEMSLCSSWLHSRLLQFRSVMSVKVSCVQGWHFGELVESGGIWHVSKLTLMHEWTTGRWDLGGGSRWLGICPGRVGLLGPSSPMSLCCLAARNWEAFLHHVLLPWCLTLSALKQWSQQTMKNIIFPPLSYSWSQGFWSQQWKLRIKNHMTYGEMQLKYDAQKLSEHF